MISDATDLRVAFLVCMPTIFLGAVILLRARHHLDEDVGKVLMAVQRAYQEQMALEEQRGEQHEEHEVASSEIGNVIAPPDDTHPERAAARTDRRFLGPANPGTSSVSTEGGS